MHRKSKKSVDFSELDKAILLAYSDESTGKLYHGKWIKMGLKFNMKPGTISARHKRLNKLENDEKRSGGIMGFLHKIFGVSI